MLLNGKKIVVMGVANKKSIAWGCAKALLEQGAEVIYTYQNDRLKKQIEKLVETSSDLIECDVSNDQSIDKAFQFIGEKYQKIDGVVHAIAYANKEELSGNISDVSRAGFSLAHDISSYSLLAVTKYAKPLLNDPGSIVSLTYFGSERVIPNYNVMGIAKASLEAAIRYLASEMASHGVRVNGISAGAIKTLAVTGVKDYNELIKMSEDRTPDKKGVTLEEIGNTCAFLLSDMASGIVGDIIYVDKGVHLS